MRVSVKRLESGKGLSIFSSNVDLILSLSLSERSILLEKAYTDKQYDMSVLFSSKPNTKYDIGIITMAFWVKKFFFLRKR